MAPPYRLPRLRTLIPWKTESAQISASSPPPPLSRFSFYCASFPSFWIFLYRSSSAIRVPLHVRHHVIKLSQSSSVIGYLRNRVSVHHSKENLTFRFYIDGEPKIGSLSEKNVFGLLRLSVTNFIILLQPVGKYFLYDEHIFFHGVTEKGNRTGQGRIA